MIDARRGELPPLLPGGAGEVKRFGEMGLFLLQAGGIGRQIADAIREIILSIFDILSPIVDIVGVGMLLFGLLLALGFRQEFYGIRLMVGGGLALVANHLIIPTLLTYV